MEKADKRVIFEGKYFSWLVQDGWEYAHRSNISGIVGIIAITEQGELLLIEQYRIPVGNRVIELPAGLAGDKPSEKNEPLETAAKRELLEETGYAAEEMTYVTHGPLSPGSTSEVLTIFRAGRIQKVAHGGGDKTESIVVHKIPLAEAGNWLAGKALEGVLIDAKVYAVLYFVGAKAN